MLIVPHPDDETLGAGGLLQHLATMNVPLFIHFVTNGEAGAITQHLSERRLWISKVNREQFGKRRQNEALDAIKHLNCAYASTDFWNFADQGVTESLLGIEHNVMQQKLIKTIWEWKPTLLIIPSLYDRHPDHNSLGLFFLNLVASLPKEYKPKLLSYLVHGRYHKANYLPFRYFELSTEALQRKREAWYYHKSQISLGKNQFSHLLTHIETFVEYSDECSYLSSCFCILSKKQQIDIEITGNINVLKRIFYSLQVWIPGKELLTIPFYKNKSATRILLSRKENFMSKSADSVMIVKKGQTITINLYEDLKTNKVFIKLARKYGNLDHTGWGACTVLYSDHPKPR